VDYQAYVGKEYPPYSVDVEKGRIRFFAKAIGTEDPIYQDDAAAGAAGYASLPAPPTFGFTLMMEGGQLFNVLEDMDIPMTRTVHGNQGFTYKHPIVAGDTITGKQTIANIFEKKGGALVFIEIENALQNQRGEDVCTLTSTIVVRNG
jgi:acyl dehydratase